MNKGHAKKADIEWHLWVIELIEDKLGYQLAGRVKILSVKWYANSESDKLLGGS